MLDTVLSWYTDPLFWQFPVMGLLIATGAFLVFALPWTLLAWFDPQWARPYKLQDKPFEVGRHIGPILGRMTLNLVIVAGLLVLAWPLLRLSGIHAGERPDWWVILLMLAFFMVLDDFLYYWMHRWMHSNKWLLKKVHSVHHRLRNPFSLAGNYFHWLELVMTLAVALAGPILLNAHVEVLYLWLIIRQFEAADGHTGYDFPGDPGHLMPGYQGALYHDFHHSHYQGNYAGFFNYLDRFFDTYVKDYEALTPRSPQ